MCEVVKVKLTVQWTSQNIGDTRNIECMRKAANSKQSHHRRELMKATTNNVIWVRLPNTFGVPVFAIYARH